MDEARRKELEELVESRSEEDRLLFHIIGVHLADVLDHLDVVVNDHLPGQDVPGAPYDDERLDRLFEMSQRMYDELIEVITELTHTIPGLPTEEEAKEELKRYEGQFWLEEALRPDFGELLDGDDDILH